MGQPRMGTPNGIDEQSLAAPQGAVLAQARAIQRQPQGRLGELMLGQDGQDVGHVMLQAQHRPAGLLQGKPGAQVVGVEIGHAGHRRNLQDPDQMFEDLLVKPEGFEIFQIADVLAGKGQGALGQAQRRLEMGPQAHHRRARAGQRHRQWHIAPGAAQHHDRRPVGPGRSRLRVQRPHHRIVGADEDVPVVEQKQLGDAGKTAQGLAVAEANGFTAGIARGHDQCGRMSRGQGPGIGFQ